MHKLVGGLSCFVLVLALLSQASADTIYLSNNARECAIMGCNFSNASIWVGDKVPSHNDTVILENTLNTTYVLLTVDIDVVVFALQSTQVDLTVYASLSTNSTTLINSAFVLYSKFNTSSFYANGNSSVLVAQTGVFEIAHGVAWFADESYLYVDGNFSSYAAIATFEGRIEASPNSRVVFWELNLRNRDSTFASLVTIYNLTAPSLTNVTFSGGLSSASVVIGPSATVTVQKYIYVSNGVTFGASSVLNVVNVGEVPDALESNKSKISWLPVNGTESLGGTLKIHSSNVTLASTEAAAISAAVEIYGENTVEFVDVKFLTNPLLFVQEENVTSRTTVVASKLYLGVPVYIIGDLQVKGGFQSNYTNVTVTGVVVGSYGDFNVVGGSFTAFNIIVGYDNRTSEETQAVLNISDHAEIYGSVWIGSEGVLYGSHGSIYGTVLNQGEVKTQNNGNYLFIRDNFIQTDAATLRVVLYESENKEGNETKPGIFVNGTAEVNGTLVVSTETSKDETFDVVQTEGNLTVHLHEDKPKLEGSGELRLQTNDPKKITVVYEHHDDDDSKSFWDTPWPWVIFSIIGALIVIIIVVFFVRRRKGYKSIE